MSDNTKEQLQRVKTLLLEFIRRLEEFDEKRIHDLNGYSDFVNLSNAICKIQENLELPKFIKAEVRKAPEKYIVYSKDLMGVPTELLKVAVWDPHSGKGIVTAFPKGGQLPDGRPPGNQYSIGLVADYLRRSVKFVQDECELVITAHSPRQITSADSPPGARAILELILAILRFVFGDPKSRLATTLITIGATGVFQQWWLPLVHAYATQRMGLNLMPLGDAEATAFYAGIAFIAIGIGMWFLLNWGQIHFPERSKEKAE